MRRAARVLLAAALGGAALAGCHGGGSPASPRSWYVSRNGNGAGGYSWATAWREPAQIDWSRIRPGDTIVIDGGPIRCRSNYRFRDFATRRPGLACGMLYRAPLVVGAGGTAGAPITIRLASAPGRNGTAVLFGGRATPLPYCDQRTYSPVGRAATAGIVIPGRSRVIIDGRHRSGLMLYGARTGVDLTRDTDHHIVLRNLEVFDNGTYRRWAHGYRTDGEGITLAGHHITIDRTLVHDNGQDEVHDRDTGVPVIGHAPLHDIAITNSWLYERRGNPRFPGYGFNSGAQDDPAQDCTHADAVQIWGGGLHQQRLTISHDVIGPLLAQGIYPGDDGVTSFDHVTVSDTLFLNPLDHAIIGPPAATPGSPGHWLVRNVTSYLTPRPNRGLDSHGQLDLAGAGHTVIDSLFVNGYFFTTRPLAAASGNVWWGGDPVPGGIRRRPRFTGPVPVGNAPSYPALVAFDLTPHCRGCAGAGSSLHQVTDLLHRIDAQNRKDP